ncbi:MAG: hypothetical protein KAR06_03310, partial [Deltaproteobacteria bacterium]|nr:hypothetical protein [Deltaproteobacteria bacterium]
EQSKAAELAKGIRPYVAAYTPLAIWDYLFEGKELVMILLQEDTDGGKIQLKRWFKDKWELWEQDEGDKYELINEGVNKLGVIPFVLLRNRDSMKKMTGISDIVDIAPLNRRIYYLDSDALEIIDRTAVPIPEMHEDSVPKVSGETGEVQSGTGNVMVRAADDKLGFQWKEPPHNSLKEIREWRMQAVNDILSIAKTSQGQAIQTEAKSGVALEIEFQELNAKISEKAFNAEDFEYRVFILVGLWQGIDLGAMIAYAKKFGIKDLAHQIETAISAKSAVPSRTYQSEVSKGIVKATLPKDTDPKIIKEIEKELDQVQPEVPEVDDNGEVA